MDRAAAEAWLDSYVRAWISYDPAEISALFSEDVAYRYHPRAVDGDVVVATGTSTYRDRPGGSVIQVFENCFVMRFDDAGRCREFTEYYLKRPDP